MNDKCSLCESSSIASYQNSLLLKCQICALVFKKDTQFLSRDKEKQRYLLHKNSCEDRGYLQFLEPVLNRVICTIPKGSRGLDYGSGPTPVLTNLLIKEGFDVQAYDPFFSPLDLSLIENLNFITCTETAEHFYNPKKEFDKIFSMLLSRGRLFLMTEFYTAQTNFSNWYYAQDITHVCFYSLETVEWIAKFYDAQFLTITSRAIEFQKNR